MIFFCDALSQFVSSDFSAAMNLIGGSQDWKVRRALWILFLCARLSASRPAKPSLCQRPLPFPIDIGLRLSASAALSASMLRGICDGGICGGTSTVEVSLPFTVSSLASRQRCSTHRKTSVRLRRRALPTGSHSCAQPSTFSERCDAASP